LYAHDSVGRLGTKTIVIDGKSFNVTYTWGDSGAALDKVTSITYPGGSKVNYIYDVKGYVNSITVDPPNSGATQTLLTGIAYNADNNPSAWLWSDGKAKAIGYDSTGQIASYTLGDPQGTGTVRTVVRDNAERIKGYTHTNNAATLDQSFDYDNLNRLTGHTRASSSTTYTYDETGNRTSKTIGATTYTNTVDSASNKYTQTQDAANGTHSVSYDAAGHVTADDTGIYTYNDRGRMNTATPSSGVVSFKYNGLSQRASKSLAGVSMYYIYDESGQLLGEYNNSGAPVYETIYLGPMPVGVISTPAGTTTWGLYNVDADQVAAPRVITDQSHSIVWRWDTAEAFGVTDSGPAVLAGFIFNQRFPGQVFDSETGLFQNWNREFNARLGRYLESDPIGLGGGINTFSYVGSQPTRYIDPSGLDRKIVNLGQGWTGGIDLIPQTNGQFEIHVFNPRGNEVGMYGPQGWFNKHGHTGAPENCPAGVESQLKGNAIDILRRSNALPPKGRLNIKGNNWTRALGPLGIAATVLHMTTLDACRQSAAECMNAIQNEQLGIDSPEPD
jgi:RHS repeat-associated protein